MKTYQKQNGVTCTNPTKKITQAGYERRVLRFDSMTVSITKDLATLQAYTEMATLQPQSTSTRTST